jgi:hypothetical protein
MKIFKREGSMAEERFSYFLITAIAIVAIVAIAGMFAMTWVTGVTPASAESEYTLVQEYSENGSLVDEWYEDESWNLAGEALRRIKKKQLQQPSGGGAGTKTVTRTYARIEFECNNRWSPYAGYNFFDVSYPCDSRYCTQWVCKTSREWAETANRFCRDNYEGSTGVKWLRLKNVC